MKKIICILLCVSLLAGCGTRFGDQSDSTEQKDPNSKTVAVPDYTISNDYYQSVLPFEPSEARGMVVSNLNSRTDLNEMETGLMRLSQEKFPTDKYYFKEGQYLDKETISSWLARKYSPEELAANGMTEEQNLGLNPIENGDPKANPEYLAHILEQDYLVQDGDKLKLGGISIGLALNSVYYVKGAEGMPPEEVANDTEVLMTEGKKIADEIVKRIRKIEGLEQVPITIALYEQAPSGSVLPGNFIATTYVDQGENTISEWQTLDEEYYLFPSSKATKSKPEDAAMFSEFQKDVETYFPNFNGVVGQGLYINDQLNKLDIDITMQFYSETEAISFTQYVAGQVVKRFPSHVPVEVTISSSDGPEALIVRTPDTEEPFVHIYN